MVDGNYAVDYRSMGLPVELTGVGLVTLDNGSLSGSDAGYRWNGSYEIVGRTLRGRLVAIPENEEAINIFGDTRPIQLEVTGDITEIGIAIRGSRLDTKQLMSAMLTRIEF